MHLKPKRASQTFEREFDYIIVGSGASGATAALTLANEDFSVAIFEEGAFFSQPDFKPDVFTASRQFFRQQGFQSTIGKSKIPVLEGSCVGGTTVMNGAILHSLPKEVIEQWVENDKNLAFTFDFKRLDQIAEGLFNELGSPSPSIGDPSLPVFDSLKKLGWQAQFMRRSAPGCLHSGRCLQGCPTGGKWSMEKSFIPKFLQKSGQLFSNTRVKKIAVEGGQAKGIITDEGTFFKARNGIFVAAGAIQTPLLLQRSRIRNPEIGKNFQTHLGVSVLAEMQQRVRLLEGPPQGIEILEFKNSNYKIATQLVPPELTFARAPFFGEELEQAEIRAEYYSTWMASLRSQTKGEVKSLFGKPRIHFTPSVSDLIQAREAFKNISTLLFSMGAKEVFLGVHGTRKIKSSLKSENEVSEIDKIPLDPRNFWLSAGHIFGTCRMSSAGGVVDPSFRLKGVKNLHVIDASVFPTNIGLNPQLSIMTLARRAIDFV